MRMNFLGQENGKFKGPEVGMSLEGPRSSQKVTVALTQQEVSLERVIEVFWATETLGVILRKQEEHWIWS